MCRKHKCRERRDAQERPPPGNFPFGESHQSHFAPEGVDRFAAALTPRLPQRVRIRHVPMPDAHSRESFSRPFGSWLRRPSVFGSPTGRKNKVAEVLLLGPVWRARATQAFARKPERAREGSRAWTARTGRSCRDTATTKARTRGGCRAI